MKVLIALSLNFFLNFQVFALAIYGGEDSRLNYSEVSNDLQPLFDKVLVAGHKSLILSDRAPRTVKQRFSICPSSRFSQEPSLGRCTGVLIAPDKILTARHCISSHAQCENTVWLSEFDNRHTSKKSMIYECQKVLYSSPFLDLSVVQLSNSVATEPVKPLSGIESETPEFSIGSSLGAYLKYSPVEAVKVKSELGWILEIDKFYGESGSPFFNNQHELTGLLVSGSEDFLKDDELGCRKYFACQIDGDCEGEVMVPYQHFPREIKDFFSFKR